MSDLLYSEDEEALRGSVRSLLAARSPLPAVLRRAESAEPYDMDLWRALAVEVGVAGLLVPEHLGGAGASAREVAVVCEELGRAAAPVPFLGSAVVATTALLGCLPAEGETEPAAGDSPADPEIAAKLLAELARGERTAVLVVSFASRSGGAVTVSGGRITGTVTSVADALTADVLLVLTEDGLYVVEATDPGVTVTPVVSLDQTRQLCDVTLDAAAGRLVAVRATGSAAVSGALLAGAALLASEQLGLAEWCLSTTVDYLKTRRQFGRIIGGYQALKHRIADVWVEVTQARAVARYAAACLADGDPDLPVAAALAQAFVGPVAVRTAEECLQLHGGIGFTWEYPIHLYLKRAKADSIAFGTAAANRAALAPLVDLDPPA